MLDCEHQKRGAIAGTLVRTLAAAVVIAAAIYFFYCPCGRMPGGYLLGSEVGEPIQDWSFANDVPVCQIQVTSWLPHSVNLNCMAAEGKLYLSCGSCREKKWSKVALANPSARLRLADKVYPVTLTRVTKSTILDQAWAARAAKLGQPPEAPRNEGWWSFHAVSR